MDEATYYIRRAKAHLTGQKLPEEEKMAISKFYESMGLMEPMSRGVATGAFVLASMIAIQPEAAFDQQGMRPFKLTSNSDKATWFHPGVVALTAGLLAMQF